jgi:hypothetical protein
MTLHPDGLALDDTPYCDKHCISHYSYECSGCLLPNDAHYLEERARTAEAKVAELERELAWLRRGLRINATYAEPYIKHLASSPPDDWKDSNA